MKAVQLDDKSADAHTSLAVFKFLYEYDWAGSESEFHRALALNLNCAYAHDNFGVALALQGRLDEAVAEGKRAAELDPLSPLILVDSIWALTWQGKYQASMELANRALDLDPTFFILILRKGGSISLLEKSTPPSRNCKRRRRSDLPLTLLAGSGMPTGRQETALEQWPS